MTTADSILEYFLTVLEKIYDHPECEISTLDTWEFSPGLDREVQNTHEVEAHSPPQQELGLRSSELRIVRDRLRPLWKKVLPSVPESPFENNEQAGEVGLGENFFDLGGDSLAAVQLTRIFKNSGIELGLQDIYDFPTLAEQCQVLVGDRERVQRGDPPPKLVFVSEREIPA